MTEVQHDINLNIHYSSPDWVWAKIGAIYSSMEYWDETAEFPTWKGENINLWASVEPGGIQIAGIMPDEIWNDWYQDLKTKLTNALGYEIGEPEDGYDFNYCNEQLEE